MPKQMPKLLYKVTNLRNPTDDTTLSATFVSVSLCKLCLFLFPYYGQRKKHSFDDSKMVISFMRWFGAILKMM